MLEGAQVDNVYSFEYLGSRHQCDGDDKADVHYRMIIAQSVFSSLSHMWSDHRLPITMKIRLYELAVCSTCEAWDTTTSVKKMLNGLNSRCLYIITNLDYRVTATNPSFNLVLAIRRRRLRYLGHILRMDTNLLLRRTLKAYVHGGEQLPEGSLLEDCARIPFEDLADLARDRKRWRKTVRKLSTDIVA